MDIIFSAPNFGSRCSEFGSRGTVFGSCWRIYVYLMVQFPPKFMINGTILIFDIVNFPFLDGNVPRRASYGVYISQLIRFARASSNLSDLNYNKALTAKLLMQGYRYFKLRKAFTKFYRRHSALVEKYSVSLKTLLQQGISESEFYGDLVYRFGKIVGTFRNNSENLLTVIKELAIA